MCMAKNKNSKFNTSTQFKHHFTSWPSLTLACRPCWPSSRQPSVSCLRARSNQSKLKAGSDEQLVCLWCFGGTVLALIYREPPAEYYEYYTQLLGTNLSSASICTGYASTSSPSPGSTFHTMSSSSCASYQRFTTLQETHRFLPTKCDIINCGDKGDAPIWSPFSVWTCRVLYSVVGYYTQW